MAEQIRADLAAAVWLSGAVKVHLALAVGQFGAELEQVGADLAVMAELVWAVAQCRDRSLAVDV